MNSLNNAKNNGKQQRADRLVGGITGKGFMPGRSGNPKGRPRSAGLINALTQAVSAVGPDGRTVEEQLVQALIEEALRGKQKLAAIQAIFDRIEGKPRQQLQITNDIMAEMGKRTNDELSFFVEHGYWPEKPVNNSAVDDEASRTR